MEGFMDAFLAIGLAGLAVVWAIGMIGALIWVVGSLPESVAVSREKAQETKVPAPLLMLFVFPVMILCWPILLIAYIRVYVN